MKRYHIFKITAYYFINLQTLKSCIVRLRKLTQLNVTRNNKNFIKCVVCGLNYEILRL